MCVRSTRRSHGVPLLGGLRWQRASWGKVVRTSGPKAVHVTRVEPSWRVDVSSIRSRCGHLRG